MKSLAAQLLEVQCGLCCCLPCVHAMHVGGHVTAGRHTLGKCSTGVQASAAVLPSLLLEKNSRLWC